MACPRGAPCCPCLRFFKNIPFFVQKSRKTAFASRDLCFPQTPRTQMLNVEPSAVRPLDPVTCPLGPRFSCLFTHFVPFSFPFSSLIRSLCPFPIKMLFQLSTAYHLRPAHTHIIDRQSGQNLHLRVASAVTLQPIVLWE